MRPSCTTLGVVLVCSCYIFCVDAFSILETEAALEAPLTGRILQVAPVSPRSECYVQMAGVYLPGYAQGYDLGSPFATLDEALLWCDENFANCGGITFEDGGYTARAGRMPIDSPYSEASWVQNEPCFVNEVFDCYTRVDDTYLDSYAVGYDSANPFTTLSDAVNWCNEHTTDCSGVTYEHTNFVYTARSLSVPIAYEGEVSWQQDDSCAAPQLALTAMTTLGPTAFASTTYAALQTSPALAPTPAPAPAQDTVLSPPPLTKGAAVGTGGGGAAQPEGGVTTISKLTGGGPVTTTFLRTFPGKHPVTTYTSPPLSQTATSLGEGAGAGVGAVAGVTTQFTHKNAADPVYSRVPIPSTTAAAVNSPASPAGAVAATTVNNAPPKEQSADAPTTVTVTSAGTTNGINSTLPPAPSSPPASPLTPEVLSVSRAPVSTQQAAVVYPDAAIGSNELKWKVQMGGPGNEKLRASIAVPDEDDSLVIVGYWTNESSRRRKAEDVSAHDGETDSLDGNGSGYTGRHLQSDGIADRDVYIGVVTSSTGKVKWSFSLGTAGAHDESYDVAYDGSDSQVSRLIMCGSTQGNWWGSLQGTQDAVVTLLDYSSGDMLGGMQMGAIGEEAAAYTVVALDDGDFIIGGMTTSPWLFPLIGFGERGALQYFWLARFNGTMAFATDTDYKTSTQWGWESASLDRESADRIPTQTAAISDIAVGPDRQTLFVVGTTNGEDLSEGQDMAFIPSAAALSSFLLAVSVDDGHLLWEEFIPGFAASTLSLSTDANGEGTVLVSGHYLSEDGRVTVGVLQFGQSGEHNGARWNYESPFQGHAHSSVGGDQGSALLVVGTIYDGDAGGQDCMMVKLSGEGTSQCVITFGSSGDDVLLTSSSADMSSTVLTGYSSGSLFAVSGGKDDIFLGRWTDNATCASNIAQEDLFATSASSLTITVASGAVIGAVAMSVVNPEVKKAPASTAVTVMLMQLQHISTLSFIAVEDQPAAWSQFAQSLGVFNLWWKAPLSQAPGCMSQAEGGERFIGNTIIVVGGLCVLFVLHVLLASWMEARWLVKDRKRKLKPADITMVTHKKERLKYVKGRAIISSRDHPEGGYCAPPEVDRDQETPVPEEAICEGGGDASGTYGEEDEDNEDGGYDSQEDPIEYLQRKNEFFLFFFPSVETQWLLFSYEGLLVSSLTLLASGCRPVIAAAVLLIPLTVMVITSSIALKHCLPERRVVFVEESLEDEQGKEDCLEMDNYSEEAEVQLEPTEQVMVPSEFHVDGVVSCPATPEARSGKHAFSCCIDGKLTTTPSKVGKSIAKFRMALKDSWNTGTSIVDPYNRGDWTHRNDISRWEAENHNFRIAFSCCYEDFVAQGVWYLLFLFVYMIVVALIATCIEDGATQLIALLVVDGTKFASLSYLWPFTNNAVNYMEFFTIKGNIMTSIALLGMNKGFIGAWEGQWMIVGAQGIALLTTVIVPWFDTAMMIKAAVISKVTGRRRRGGDDEEGGKDKDEGGYNGEIDRGLFWRYFKRLVILNFRLCGQSIKAAFVKRSEVAAGELEISKKGHSTYGKEAEALDASGALSPRTEEGSPRTRANSPSGSFMTKRKIVYIKPQGSSPTNTELRSV